jgi:hypothetical protein
LPLLEVPPNFFVLDHYGKRIFFESAQDYQRFRNGDLPSHLRRSTPRTSDPTHDTSMKGGDSDSELPDAAPAPFATAELTREIRDEAYTFTANH